MRQCFAVVWVLLCLAFASAPVDAQVPPSPPTPAQAGSEYVDFLMQPESTFQWVSLSVSGHGPDGPIGPSATFNIHVTDTSFDTGAATQAAPSGPQSSALVTLHHFSFSVKWVGGAQPGSWVNASAMSPPAFTYRGTSFDGQVFLVTPTSNNITEASINVTGRIWSDARPDFFREHSETFTARIYPNPALQMQIQYTPNNLKAKPNQPVVVPLLVQNVDLYPAQVNIAFHIDSVPGVDPSSIAVLGLNSVYLLPLESRYVNVTVVTPKALTWYRSVPLTYTASVSTDQGAITVNADGVMILDGFYFSRSIIVLLPILFLLLILFILVLLIGKRYYEEQILGKPIPPWRVPEEARMLEQLRKDDPRTFYITRYFLMVEEYESALNWFYSYKKRSKKALKRTARSERLVDKANQLKDPSLDKFDRRAVRIKKRFHRKEERRRLQLEAELEKLQGKLDQHYEEDYENDHKKWEAKVEKLKKKASKPWYKAHKKWERDVEKILAAWEKPFAKEKAKTEKETAKAKEKYASQAKKKDKDAWQAWREAVLAAERENRIREKEGREPLPEPELVSSVLGPATLPKPFKEPPKPKLPAEPKEPAVEGLPPEPQLAQPKLEASHYARKVKRMRKKADRKIARLEKKMNRLLARNERDRVRAIAKAGRDREKLLKKSHDVTQPTLRERVFRATPEDREHRAHKKLLKALAKERYRTLKESEATRLEVLQADAARREAELVSQLLREGQRGEVRKGAGASGMQIESDARVLELREENEARLAKEQAASAKKLAAERARLDKELRDQLTEELVKERVARAEAAAADKAAAQKAAEEAAAAKAATKKAAQDEAERKAAAKQAAKDEPEGPKKGKRPAKK